MNVMFGGNRVATTSTPNTALGLGCVALFLLPFAGSGSFAGWQAVQRATQGNWREALFFLPLRTLEPVSRLVAHHVRDFPAHEELPDAVRVVVFADFVERSPGAWPRAARLRIGRVRNRDAPQSQKAE